MMNMTDVSPEILATARRIEHEHGLDRQASEDLATFIHEMRADFNAFLVRLWLLFAGFAGLIVTLNKLLA